MNVTPVRVSMAANVMTTSTPSPAPASRDGLVGINFSFFIWNSDIPLMAQYKIDCIYGNTHLSQTDKLNALQNFAFFVFCLIDSLVPVLTSKDQIKGGMVIEFMI